MSKWALEYQIGESIAYETCEGDRETGEITAVEWVDDGWMLHVLDHVGFIWRIKPREVLEVLPTPDVSTPEKVTRFLTGSA